MPRAYLQAMLGFVLYAHHRYTSMKGSEAHSGEEAGEGHEHWRYRNGS
jgi:hypothetical protein